MDVILAKGMSEAVESATVPQLGLLALTLAFQPAGAGINQIRSRIRERLGQGRPAATPFHIKPGS